MIEDEDVFSDEPFYETSTAERRRQRRPSVSQEACLMCDNLFA